MTFKGENIENNFSALSKRRTIETPTLSVKGNLLFWNNTLIQINNISMITITNLEKLPFPLQAILILVVGFIILFASAPIGLIIIAIGGGWVFLWVNKNSELDTQMHLNILLNSGNWFTILFENKDFLSEVHTILINILSSSEPNYNITFDIKNNTFHDDSGVFT